MTAAELAAWLVGRGWTVITTAPAVVVVHRGGMHRRTYHYTDGYWCIADRKGRRTFPGSRSDEV